VIVEALEDRGVPHAYIAFAGEGHGFRKSENAKRALEAHLSFLAQIFGFDPADHFQPIEIENLEHVAR
jgi:dipeptidyl aminopeptidase/acylaminoacyl peptidase